MRLRASTVLNQGVCLLLVATSSTCGLLAGSTSRRILCHEAGSRSRRSTSVVMKLARPRAADRRGIACTARTEQHIQNGSNVSRGSRGEAAAAAPSGVSSIAAAKAVPAAGPPGVRRRRVGKPGTGDRGAVTPGKGDVTWHFDARSGAWAAEEMAGAGGSAMQSLRQVGVRAKRMHAIVSGARGTVEPSSLEACHNPPNLLHTNTVATI